MLRFISGLVCALLGWIAVSAIYCLTMLVVALPWFASAILAMILTDNDTIRLFIMAPATLFLFIFFFWFASRFVLAGFFGIWGMAGLVFHKSADVTPSRIANFLVERAQLMRSDLVWYFSKVKS
ncbi:MAG: hypothetical protein AAGA08_10600 [Pseudomonadota bacterium]